MVSEHMEPRPSIATDINIYTAHEFHFISTIEINAGPATAPVVSPHKLWLTIILLLIALFTGNAEATTIVLFVGSDQIIIAADGVVTSMTDGHGAPQPFCKVRQSGETYYAIAGDYGPAKTDLDVWELVRTALGKSNSLADVYASARSVIMPKLKAIADKNKVADPIRYSKLLHGDPVIEMAFAKFKKNIPMALGVTFYIDRKGRPIDPPVRNIMESGSDSAPAIARLGLHDGIEVFLATPQSSQWPQRFRADVVDALRYLVQIEIDRATREKRFDVGPPISILRITKDGAGFAKGFAGNCPSLPAKQKPEETRKTKKVAKPAATHI